MIRLFIILVGIALGILFVPEQWGQEGREFIGHYADQFKAPLFKEVHRFRGFINDPPSPLAGLSPKPLADSSLRFLKKDEADCDEILELQEKLFHSLKLLEGDDDK